MGPLRPVGFSVAGCGTYFNYIPFAESSGHPYCALLCNASSTHAGGRTGAQHACRGSRGWGSSGAATHAHHGHQGAHKGWGGSGEGARGRTGDLRSTTVVDDVNRWMKTGKLVATLQLLPPRAYQAQEARPRARAMPLALLRLVALAVLVGSTPSSPRAAVNCKATGARCELPEDMTAWSLAPGLNQKVRLQAGCLK